MPVKCIKCKKTIRKNQHGIPCDTCKEWTHRTCGTGISRELYLETVSGHEALSYFCDQCGVPADESSVPGTPTAESSRLSQVETNTGSTSNIEASIVRSETMALDLTTNINFDEEEDIQERSLLDRNIDSSSEVADTVPCTTYQIIKNGSQKGKDKLVDNNGFCFVIRSSTNGRTYWTCSVRNKRQRCPATVIQTSNGFSSGRHHHVHAPQPGTSVAVKLRTMVKTKAVQNMFKSARNIVEEELINHVEAEQPAGARDKICNVIRVANRVREKQRPKEPKNLDFELVHGVVPDGFLQCDLRVGSARHLLFSTETQLKQLHASRQWFLDGTFKIVKRPFNQLFSIHAFVRSGNHLKMLPLAFILMSRRKKQDYTKVFNSLKELMGDHPAVQAIVGDFEKAFWGAVKTVWPRVRMRGCLFHLTQSVWRKCQEVGLSLAYKEKDSIFKFIRQLMALPFLPQAHIRPTFQKLSDRAKEGGKLNALLNYFENQWMENSTFPVKSWCVFGQTHRTNNYIEGWHHRINNKSSGQQLSLYRMIPLLYEEARLVPIQRVMVEEKNLTKYLRRRAVHTQQRIMKAWEDYRKCKIGVSCMLATVSTLHGPSRLDV